MIDPVLQLVVRTVRRSPFLRRMVADLVERAKEGTPDFERFPELAEFADSRGHAFVLRSGVRDHVNPGWHSMCDPTPATETLAQRESKARARGSLSDVRRFANLLRPYSGGLEDKTVLEIECYDGAHAFALAKAGTDRVVASDVSAYYVQQSIATTDADEQSDRLVRLRTQLAASFNASTNAVEFVQDDITASSLPSEMFDVICSWEVLEHVADPAATFSEMSRLLKPGGISIHDYNPFFCLSGGHSLCGLDFVWGHVRLNPEDFARYVRQFRPAEAEAAINFFEYNLNRMTLLMLRDLCTRAGLQELSIIPAPKQGHATLVTSTIMEQCRAVHPTVTLLDLITPRVVAIHRKP